jgi:hypothetical protein
MEADIWKTQPPDKIGRRVQPPCIPETAWIWNEEFSFFEGETTCSPEAHWAQEEAQGRHDQLLFPAGVAIYEPTARAIARGFPATRRVLVADRYNHRMLVFLPGPNGTWIPLDQAIPADVAAAHWNGFQMPAAPWPAEFDGLMYPEHLTVDRAGFVWVANLAKCRIEVFTPTGRFQAAIQLSDTCNYFASVGLFPYGVAVNDDAEYGVAGRVAVVAQDYSTQGSQVVILNAATGAVVGRHAPDPFVGQLDDPGAFNRAIAIDYLRVGGVDRLVVADTDNNRVQVFDTEPETEPNAGAPKPVPVLMFGATELTDPTTGQPISESRLQWPYSLHVDARGRLLVSDSVGNRETFFTLDFSGSEPTVKFLFELNARGGLNGVPRGVAEDSDHSLYIVDTGNHEVEVFEIPELAIVNVGTVPPAPRVNNTIHVDFTVLVPETKSMVPNVTATCDVLSGGVTLLAGPVPIDGTASGAIDMLPVPSGGVHRYRCDFRATNVGPFAVIVGAQGGPNGTEVTAPSKIASGTIADCSGPCEAEAPTITAVVTDPAPVNQFYPGDATITLTATDVGAGDIGASGIKRIYWKWVSSSAMSQVSIDPLLACPGQPTPTQCVDYATGVPVQSVTVMATAEGLSTLEFWTEDFHGNISAHNRLAIAIDTIPPMITASLRTASTSRNSSWFNADVFIDLTFSDPFGLTQPSQVVTTPANTHALHFATEGRNLTDSVTATDLAGNSESFVSTLLVVVNIDKSAPQTTAVSTLGLLTDNQVFLQSQPPVLSFTAIDPQLSTGEDGSGVIYTGLQLDRGPRQSLTPGLTLSVPALGPHSLEYWSKDQAGNEEPHAMRAFYVNALPTATPDTATTNEDTAVNVNVLANDTDANDRATDPFTVTIVTASNGTAMVQPNQSVTFAPEPNFSGTAAFTYQVSDAHGGTATASVTVTVIATNVAPVAVNDVIPAVLDGSPAMQFNVLTNDTDADGDVLALASFSPLSPSIGTLASLGNGVFSFTPPASVGSAPVTATFTYLVRDAAGASATGTVTITVNPGNRAPICGSAYGGEIWPPNHKTYEVAPINGVTDPDG